MPQTQTISVTPQEQGQRLDVFCVSQLPGVSRSALQQQIKARSITVNGKAVKANYTVRTGDTIALTLPPSSSAPVVSSLPTIPILFEDKDLVVINKPAGVTMYAGQGLETGTVADWFKRRYGNSPIIGPDEMRSGIVHRLDKETSGVVLLARTQEMYDYLQAQFSRQRPKKEYLALIFGIPGMKDGRINQPLARSKRYPLRRTIDASGRPAITEWQREESFGNAYALLRVFPLTGRMHQIRVHLHFLGYPIVGDRLYTYKKQRPPQGVQRQMLHAVKLTMKMLTGKYVIFEAPPPEDFTTVLNTLRHGV